MEYKNSFVFYESIGKQFERLLNRGKREEALDYIAAVIKYGLYREEPAEEAEVWDYGLDSAFSSIGSAKVRYEKSKIDGGKGGRKRLEIDMDKVWELIEEGYTYSQIADVFGCSKNTIANRIAESKNTKTTKNQIEQPIQKLKNNKNLNVNVNDNGNVYGNGNAATKTEILNF